MLGTAQGRNPGPHVQLATVPGAMQPVGCSKLGEGKDEADGSWEGWWHHPDVGGRRRLLLVLSPPHQIRRCHGRAGLAQEMSLQPLSAALASKKIIYMLALYTVLQNNLTNLLISHSKDRVLHSTLSSEEILFNPVMYWL